MITDDDIAKLIQRVEAAEKTISLLEDDAIQHEKDIATLQRKIIEQDF